MDDLADKEAIWLRFVFPVIQDSTAIAIAFFASKQEKWARINLSKKFLERLSNLASSYDYISRLIQNQAPEYEVYKALQRCRSVLLEAELAAKLYKRVEKMVNISKICLNGLNLIPTQRHPRTANSDFGEPEQRRLAAAKQSTGIFMKKVDISKLDDLRDQLYQAIGNEFNIDDVLKNI